MPPSGLEPSVAAFGSSYAIPEDEDEFNEIPRTPFPTKKPVPTDGKITITDGNFVWDLAGVASNGTFVSGAHWVVPINDAVTVTRISPPATTTTFPETRHSNGSMLDPGVHQMSPNANYPGSVQGYDSSMYGKYKARNPDGSSADYSDALNVGNKLPLEITPDSSLVSTASLAAAGARPQVRDAAVLTVLSTVPPANSFRPFYGDPVNGTKEIFSSAGIDYAALRILTDVGGSPSFAAIASKFRKCRLSHTPQFLSRWLHPVATMQDYGRDLCAQSGVAAIMCLLDVDQATKQPLLEGFLQYGIDLYGVAKVTRDLVKSQGATDQQARLYRSFQPFPSNGGHGSGIKWPILFAGMVLGNQDMIDITADDGPVMFAEDDSTYYIGPGNTNPEWADRYLTNPERTNPIWVALGGAAADALTGQAKLNNQAVKYRRCCTANVWYGQILAAACMPGGRTNWGHEALFDYQIRYRATEPQYSGPQNGFFLYWPSYNFDWVYDMFEANKATYGLV